MPSLINTLFLVIFALVAFANITGLLKFAFKDNEVISLLHKMTGPVVNLLYLIVFITSTLLVPKMFVLGKTLLFILLVYAGLVTGNFKDKPGIIIVHRVLGILTLAISTGLLVMMFLKR